MGINDKWGVKINDDGDLAFYCDGNALFTITKNGNVYYARELHEGPRG